LIQGIADATMTHSEGWDFIRIGRFLERADNTSRILDVKYHLLLPSGEKVGGNIDTVQWMSVLKSCSALEAYRKIYVGQVAPWKVAEFLITHPEFPRSIRFSVDSLDAALHRISGSPETNYANEAERLSGRLRYDLDFATIATFGHDLHEYLILTQTFGEISGASKSLCHETIPGLHDRGRANRVILASWSRSATGTAVQPLSLRKSRTRGYLSGEGGISLSLPAESWPLAVGHR
jgi:hypothetical protein